MRRYTFIILLLIFTLSEANTLRNYLPKYKKENLKSNFKRILEDQKESDSYIVISFKEDCNYPKGFKNEYRSDISHLIEKQNNTKLKQEESFFIRKGIKIEIHINISITSLEYFFSEYYDDNMIYLESVDLSNFDSSLVNNLGMMFYNCSSLKYIDFSNFDTSLITDMYYMFETCSSLESIDLSNFNTSLVTDMYSTFSGCSSLT